MSSGATGRARMLGRLAESDEAQARYIELREAEDERRRIEDTLRRAVRKG